MLQTITIGSGICGDLETGDAISDSLNKINNGYGGSLSRHIECGALMHKCSLGDLVKSLRMPIKRPG